MQPFKIMAKTPIFHAAQKALRLAQLADLHHIPADEVSEWADEKRPSTITRRDFLQKMALGAAGIAALSLLPSMARRPESELQIVIVGGGMAGLHAAHILKKHGISQNVRIYEASNRTGGRMMTQKLNGNSGTTELGGEFVDQNHADIRSLAREFGVLELHKSSDNLGGEFFLMEGKTYHEVDFIREFQKIRKQVGKDSKKRGAALLALDRMDLGTYLAKLPIESWFRKLLEVAYLGEYGLEVAEQSALNFVWLVGKQAAGEFRFFGDSDESIKLLGGNQQLCDRLADGLRDQIILDAPLVAIRDAGSGYSLTFQNMKQAVQADVVIMTVPYTVLREIDGIDKLAAMSAAKLKCIRELGAGQNGKYFLDMKERIWRSQGHQGYLYTPSIHTSWDSHHFQNENAGKSIYSVFLGGKAGTEIAKGGGEAHLAELNQAFPGFQAQYTGFTAQMNWWKHPWSKGSYICPRPGQYAGIGGEIAKPVGRMLFAGEHVSVDFGGFMNGAAETGRLAAEEVLKVLQGK
jgi:monoamine oxidase